jgi:ankyrin repeat protein
MYACEFGHVEAVQKLLQKGARCEATDKSGWKPLDYAVASGKEPAAAELRAHRAQHSLFFAAQKGMPDELAKVIATCQDINVCDSERNKTPLIVASEHGQVEAVRVLVGGGACLDTADKDGWTPLMHASAGGHVDAVRLLLGKGASLQTVDKPVDKGALGKTALWYAAENRHKVVVGLLITAGIAAGQDVNAACESEYGKTPLMYASEFGELEAVRELLGKRASLEAVNKYGSTPLIYASMAGELETVRELLGKGTNLEAVDKGGWTALKCAEMRGHSKVVALLKEHGASK